MRMRHPCMLRLHHSCMALLVLLTLEASASIEPVPEPPPEPVYPSREGLDSEQWYQLWKQWRTAHDQWKSELTIGQLEMLRARNAVRRDRSDPDLARARRLPTKEDSYDWQATAQKWALAPSIIAGLQRDGLAFGDSTKQIFEPYLGGPVFITSDSALHAFHVLFEDSFRELEVRRASDFRPRFERLLALARDIAREGKRPRHWIQPMPDDRAQPAIDHLVRVLGPALVLSGAPLQDFDSRLRPDIASTLELIRGAERSMLPTWLGPADDVTLVAIDFTRCRPVGFYADSAKLSDYFRAVRWLQMVPFRATRSHEMDAIFLLGMAAYRLREHSRDQRLDELIGPPDDPSMHVFTRSVFDNNDAPPDWADPGTRAELTEFLIRRDYYRINSDLRRARTLNQTFESLTFRIIAPAALEDSILFQALMDRRLPVSGLSVASALGSPLARRATPEAALALVDACTEELDAAVQEPAYAEPRLYARYLHTLRALFLPVAPAAPEFMRRPIWEVKSCQTALAGWAQMRHTFSLQGKLSVSYGGMVLTPPGFVEGNPEFFARLARLIDHGKESLLDAGVFSPSAVVEAEELRQAANTLRLLRPARDNSHEFEGVPYPQLEPIWDVLPDGIFKKEDPSLEELRGDEFDSALQTILARIEAYAQRLEAGTIAPRTKDPDLPRRWDHLSAIVHTLEALAHKGLRHEAWTEEEDAFLKTYGERMAYVEGYYGNSWLNPKDDAPRWAEVCAFPDRGTSLAAAVGRPREIFVLHPWNGIDVLCRGGVMQYYEHESSSRLTDAEWRTLLDSPDAPPLPSWMSGYAEPPNRKPQRH